MVHEANQGYAEPSSLTPQEDGKSQAQGGRMLDNKAADGFGGGREELVDKEYVMEVWRLPPLRR